MVFLYCYNTYQDKNLFVNHKALGWWSHMIVKSLNTDPCKTNVHMSNEAT